MRLRVIAAVVAVAAFLAVAWWWRAVIPFRDTLVGHLPEETLAYIHVNLTPRVRRDALVILTRLGREHGGMIVDALTAAVRSAEVRELGAALYRTPDGISRAALLIGQRPSPRPDMVMSVGEVDFPIPLRAYVIRTAAIPASDDVRHEALATHRHRPVQAFLRPRSFAVVVAPLERAAHLFPEQVTVGGTVDRRGIFFQIDRLLPLSASLRRSVTVELAGPLDSGVLQALRVPIRELATSVDLVLPGMPAGAWRANLPETADFRISRSSVLMAVPAHPSVEMMVRAAIAAWWPGTNSATIDGLPATIMVADPDSVTIDRSGGGAWTLHSSDGRGAIRSVALGDGRSVLSWGDGDAESLRPTLIHIPPRCVADGGTPRAFLVYRAFPQIAVAVSMDSALQPASVCGFFDGDE